MTIQSDYTVGLAKESQYGTPVTVTRFYEADSSLTETVTTAQGVGSRPGTRVARATRRAVVKRESAGDITLDAATVGMGLLLNAFFGAVTVTKDGATDVYQQVHTLKTSDFGDSYTIQQGVPRLGGSTDAYTFSGAQCGQLNIEARADSIVTMTTSWVARALSREIAYAAPSYPAALDLFTFVGGQITVGAGTFTAPTTTVPASQTGGPTAVVREASIAFNNGLDAGGFNLGGQGMRSRKAAYAGNSAETVTGSFTVEYTDQTFVDAYLDQEDLSMVLDFEGPTDIDTGEKPLLQIAIPLLRLEGDLPTGNGGDVITVTHNFVGLQDATGEPVYVVYRSLDTAV